AGGGARGAARRAGQADAGASEGGDRLSGETGPEIRGIDPGAGGAPEGGAAADARPDAGAGGGAEDARPDPRRLPAQGRRGDAGDARGAAGAQGGGYADAAGPGAVDRGPGQPADGPGGGELGLAQILRPGYRPDAGGLRHPGREAGQPGAA